MISFIQVPEASLVLGSNGHPHKVNLSFMSYLELISIQSESNGDLFTSMVSSENDLCSESYLVFS